MRFGATTRQFALMALILLGLLALLLTTITHVAAPILLYPFA